MSTSWSPEPGDQPQPHPEPPRDEAPARPPSQAQPYPQYPQAPQAYPQPHQPGIAPLLSPSEQRTWAIFAHLGPFVIGIFAPLIIFLVYKDRGPFLRRHAVESLNYQISLLIYFTVGTVVTIVISVVTIGIGAVVAVPLLLIAIVVAYIFLIVAAVAASRGEEYRYPFCLRFVH